MKRARPITTVVLVTTALAFGLAFGLPAPGARAAPYPSQLPDFAHPSDSHQPYFNFTGGRTDRPMLVIYAQFEDVTFADTTPSGLDAAYMADRFFGPFPSVADYFADDSSGHLILTPAAETDSSNNGAAGDGVVSVTVEMDKSDFIALGREAEVKMLLEFADPYVDYAGFDDDRNGRLTQDELLVARQDVDGDPPGRAGCATSRRVDPVTLDGTDLGGSGRNLKVVNAGTDTNLITLAHEAGHAAFDMPDLYFWGVGTLDVAGPTCGIDDDELFRVNAWQKLHIGWTTPTVITEDGYYDVRRPPRSSGGALIVYNPGKGTDDYFVVENRARLEGTYDQTASDTGLVIWRIDDDEFVPAGGGTGPIALMRPDKTPTGNGYGGSSTDAWDPGDRRTPQRTMAMPWRDGTPSQVAVRAVPAASAVMRTFFDVRGPGVLVDALTDRGVPMRVNVTPEEINRPPVTVMNTGEETDTFTFSYEGAPADWDSIAHRDALDDHEGTTSRAAVIPSANAPTGVYPVTIVGRSQTDAGVSEHAFLELNVVLDPTRIEYVGETRGRIGEPAGFEALVTNPGDDGAPTIAGIEVVFELSGPGGTLRANATTNADGVADADPLIELPPGDYALTVSSERHGKHGPASITAGYHVLTAAERVAELQEEVDAAGLADGTERSLTAELDGTLAALERSNTASACGALRAFINEVRALEGKHLAPAVAAALTAEAKGIRAQLGCGEGEN